MVVQAAEAVRGDRARISACGGCAQREAHIARQLLRFRDQNRLSARQLRAGQVEVENVEVAPQPVAPGGRVTVTVRLVERAGLVGPGDPDLCDPEDALPVGTGLNTRVEVNPSWTGGTSELLCVPVFSFSEGRASTQFSFPAPQVPEDVREQAFAINYNISLPGSGQQSGSGSVSVTARAGAREQPRNGNGGGGGGGDGTGPLLPCFADPNRSCGRFETIAWSGAGFLTLMLLALGR